METHIPSAEAVRGMLAGLSIKQVAALSELSGVPAPTIYKIKNGDTTNPGIETVRKFIGHISKAAPPVASDTPAVHRAVEGA
jgi:predicted transcriptional regulator